MLATAFRVGREGLHVLKESNYAKRRDLEQLELRPYLNIASALDTFRPSVTSLQFRHDKTHQLGALAQHVLPLEPGITLAFDKYLLTLQLKEEDLPSSAKSSKAICDGGAHLALTTALTTALHEAHGDAAA